MLGHRPPTTPFQRHRPRASFLTVGEHQGTGKGRGRQFWTFGCHNCKATLPNLQALYAEHQGEDFEIVGIHSPEFDYEKEPDAIAAAGERLGVTWPIALDTRRVTFFGWQGGRAYWPRTYVLDRDGRIRFDHIGEGAYEELNETIARNPGRSRVRVGMAPVRGA
jgi:thiol-disulfide isomerase/thioredoxin